MNLTKLITGILHIIASFYILLVLIAVHVVLGWSGGWLSIVLSLVELVIGFREVALSVRDAE